MPAGHHDVRRPEILVDHPGGPFGVVPVANVHFNELSGFRAAWSDDGGVPDELAHGRDGVGRGERFAPAGRHDWIDHERPCIQLLDRFRHGLDQVRIEQHACLRGGRWHVLHDAFQLANDEA